MITQFELSEIRARCEAATPGPWKLCHHLESEEKDKSCPCGFPGDIWGPDFDGRMNNVVCGIGPHCYEGSDMIPRYERSVELKNAAFIAASREDIPKLLDEVERLRKALGEE